MGSAWGSPCHACCPQSVSAAPRRSGTGDSRVSQLQGDLSCWAHSMGCLSLAQPHGGTAALQEWGGGSSRDGEKQGGIWHVPSSALTVTS